MVMRPTWPHAGAATWRTAARRSERLTAAQRHSLIRSAISSCCCRLQRCSRGYGRWHSSSLLQPDPQQQNAALKGLLWSCN